MINYHKIKGVPLNECTAEQKIAYNLSFSYYDLFIKKYVRLKTQRQKSELVAAAIQKMLNGYRLSYGYKPGKYNEETIFYALNAGFENYLNAKHHILSSYKEVGECFPITTKTNQ